MLSDLSKIKYSYYGYMWIDSRSHSSLFSSSFGLHAFNRLFVLLILFLFLPLSVLADLISKSIFALLALDDLHKQTLHLWQSLEFLVFPDRDIIIRRGDRSASSKSLKESEHLIVEVLRPLDVLLDGQFLIQALLESLQREMLEVGSYFSDGFNHFKEERWGL